MQERNFLLYLFSGYSAFLLASGLGVVAVDRWDQRSYAELPLEQRIRSVESDASRIFCNEAPHRHVSWPEPYLLPHQLFAMQEGYMYLWLAGVADTIEVYAPAYFQVDKLEARAMRNPYYRG